MCTDGETRTRNLLDLNQTPLPIGLHRHVGFQPLDPERPFLVATVLLVDVVMTKLHRFGTGVKAISLPPTVLAENPPNQRLLLLMLVHGEPQAVFDLLGAGRSQPLRDLGVHDLVWLDCVGSFDDFSPEGDLLFDISIHSGGEGIRTLV